MKKEKRKVAVIGALNVDIGGRADEVFTPGDSIPGQVRSTLGGVGWNIARNCALLGAGSAFCSVLGLDEHTNSILAQAEEMQVSLEYCRWEEQPNNRYLYITDHQGDMVAAVNDMRLCARVDSGFVEELLPKLQGFGAVVCDANLPAETLRLLADGVNAPLVADGVSAVKCVRLRENLHRLHVLKVNLMEARTLAGETDARACVRALLEKGVKKVVVKNNRGEYTYLISAMGLDSVVSPKAITCSNILRYVRARVNGQGTKVEKLYRLMDGKAEVLEFIARSGDSYIGIPLRSLNIRANTLVAVIVHKGKVIVPFGNDHIEAGDSVVIMTCERGIRDLNEVIGK